MNDNSSLPDLYEPLENYLAENFQGKVKLFHNRERLGLIVTRLQGAEKATGDVIVFLDSHMEVMTNWLPPLLDPIKENMRTATVPVIDKIQAKNLRYEVTDGKCQGGFNWDLRYQYFIPTKKEEPPDDENFVLAAMTGGAYAIDRKYFFELGGYDRGMFLYNGENYELSFKLHLCGGSMLKVPCSRVGELETLESPQNLTLFLDCRPSPEGSFNLLIRNGRSELLS
jgi:polypeptide N-acetylgalactosaminyltransferase